MKRIILAVGMNLVVPGSGLIALGRLWLGVALAVWFVLGAEVVLCAILIAPATIPPFIMVMGSILAVAAWFLAQGLLVSRIRFLRGPSMRQELTILRQVAEDALAQKDHDVARSALRLALSIDDDDLPTRILWARLVTETESRPRARRAWVDAARLDRDQAFEAEIRAALDQ